MDDAFFNPSQTSCVDQAARLSSKMGDNVICMCLGPLNNYKDELQAEIVQALISQGLVDGLVISAQHLPTITLVIIHATEQSISAVTFESEAPKSR